MLSEDEKARIRLEEVFREELREELKTAKAKTWRKQALAFFNSALGIWLLSSVALGFVTWTYSRWTETLTKERENREAVEKLEIEIAARIKRFCSLATPSTFSDISRDSNETYFIALISLDNPSAQDKLSLGVFPEFAHRGLRSLLWELQTRVPVSERPCVEFAQRVAEQLSLRVDAAIHNQDLHRRGMSSLSTRVYEDELKQTRIIIHPLLSHLSLWGRIRGSVQEWEKEEVLKSQIITK